MATKHDLPAFVDYLVPTVNALKNRGGSATIEELEDDVAELLALSDDILAVPHGDGGSRSQFQYELAWVRTYLKKAGALENSERAVWRLTPIGAKMSDADLRDVPRKVRAESKRQREEDTEIVDAIVEQGAEDTGIFWKERLLNAVMEISPSAFERLCQRLLRESGFTKVEVTGRSGDGGIDGNGVLRVQLVSFNVLFQSKRWKGSVGAPVVVERWLAERTKV